jgi:two-component sensor histidine kinase
MSSLLSLQADAVESDAARVALAEARNRVHAIADIHQLLYRAAELAHVDVRTFIERLVARMRAVYDVDDDRVTVEVKGEPLRIDVPRLGPIALILSELVANAFRHAFPARRRGRIEVLVSAGSEVAITVADDGVGMPAGARTRGGRTLGWQLVELLVAQLEGGIDVRSPPGTRVTVSFPHVGS